MKKFTKQLSFMAPAHQRQIVQVSGSNNNGSAIPSTNLLAERKALIDYDSSMRRHAAACEAGR